MDKKYIVAIAYEEEQAAEIVTAVNSHDDLLDALRKYVRVHDTDAYGERCECPECQIARAAIEKATP